MRKHFLSSSIKEVSRISGILVTAGIFSYCYPVYADVNGIPYNSDFPKAQYPYAQAPDGCSGWQSTREVRDSWGPVKFTGACDTHDKCYYTSGSNWNTCNERFYSDLRAACERDLRTEIKNPLTGNGTGKYLPPDPIRLSTCYSLATSYYAGVQAGVLFDVFNEAQDKQKRYEKWVASVRNSAPNYNRLNARAVGCYYIRSLNNNFRNANFRWLDAKSDGAGVGLVGGQSHGTVWLLEETEQGSLLRSTNQNYRSNGSYRWLDGMSNGTGTQLVSDTSHGAFWRLEQVQGGYHIRSLNNNFRSNNFRWLDGASNGNVAKLVNGTSHGTLWELNSTSCP